MRTAEKMADDAHVILIVDDDAAVRSLLADVLLRGGHRCEILQAGTGREAMVLLESRACDCVVLDYMLPDTDGLQVLARMQERGIDAAVVMLTGMGDELTAVKAMKAGAFDYLPKSSIGGEDRFYFLSHTIENAVRHRREALERRKIEKVLRKNEERYRGIVDNSPIMIIRFFPSDNSVSFVNQGFCGYFRTTPFEVLGEDAVAILFGNDRAEFTALKGRICAGSPLANTERMIILDGEPHYLVWSVQALFDDEGAIWEYQCVGSDITDLRLVEQRRRILEERARLAGTLHAIGVGVISTDARGRIDLVNRTAEQITGWSCDEALGRQCAEVLAPMDGDSAALLPGIGAPADGPGGGDGTEFKLKARDGTWKNISLTASILEASGSAGSGTVLGFLDVTERRRLERLVAERKDYLQSIIDSQKNMVLVIDRASVRLANKRFMEFFGIARETDLDCLQARIRDMVVDEDECVSVDREGGWIGALAESGGESALVAFRPPRRKKARVFHADVSRLSIDGELRVVTFTDVTGLDEKRRAYKRRASLDPLTGAYNRTRFNEALADQAEIARRYGSPLSLVFMDIDHFKSINDGFGHQAGDSVLIELTRLVRRMTRRSDLFARWGGEEFTLLLPNTDAAKARHAAEKIRHEVECGRFAVPGSVTCSFGVTEFNESDTAESFIARADEALYLAKQMGRNRVETRL